MQTEQALWKRVRGTIISAKPVLPGVWRRREGGFVIRARAVEARTGLKREIWKTLPNATEEEAKAWHDAACERIRQGIVEHVQARERFRVFAARLLERKKGDGDIQSEAGVSKWRSTLKRWAKSQLFQMYVDSIRPQDLLAWRSDAARLVKEQSYAPTTMNSDLAVLRVIFRAAKLDFELSSNPAADIPPLDTSRHRTYTREEPNSLRASELREFLACLRERFPQHFAMSFLGFTTGLRPSSLRPLRRAGATPDVLWGERVLLVRRSHTLGEVTMVGTKTGVDLEIALPEELLEVLRWHVATQLQTPEQQTSELLFPAETGGFRSRAVLQKPFAEVAKAIGLTKRITARAMRRTFQDVCREAHVADVVARSICGHATEAMQRRYSTVSGSEQADGLARVIRLFEVAPLSPSHASGRVEGESTSEPEKSDRSVDQSDPSLTRSNLA